jgi:hypothetical protein
MGFLQRKARVSKWYYMATSRRLLFEMSSSDMSGSHSSRSNSYWSAGVPRASLRVGHRSVRRSESTTWPGHPPVVPCSTLRMPTKSPMEAVPCRATPQAPILSALLMVNRRAKTGSRCAQSIPWRAQFFRSRVHLPGSRGLPPLRATERYDRQ